MRGCLLFRKTWYLPDKRSLTGVAAKVFFQGPAAREALAAASLLVTDEEGNVAGCVYVANHVLYRLWFVQIIVLISILDPRSRRLY